MIKPLSSKPCSQGWMDGCLYEAIVPARCVHSWMNLICIYDKYIIRVGRRMCLSVSTLFYRSQRDMSPVSMLPPQGHVPVQLPINYTTLH